MSERNWGGPLPFFYKKNFLFGDEACETRALGIFNNIFIDILEK